ncbi:hypothetical protein [Zunongwangia profunda]|uniref:hypothetical protein n=1 Tax=Zunongwangia profunda TaxID=398743 RepID=UPI001D18B5BC|nr:hypothetical protein [Zunongwangia profunda]MCC4229632.1 hypothetical protein [Zunongwangia profunda]
MDNRQNGAWLLHHTNKLQNVTKINNFENLYFAGKCGILLSALSESENESKILNSKVEIIAKASGINTVFELPLILTKLKDQHLIDFDLNGNVAVLGVTSSTVLTYTNNIFQERSPSSQEKASLELSELTSKAPLDKNLVSEYISDTYKLSNPETEDLLNDSEQIGFIDHEVIENNDKLYFNGNLFRKGELNKIDKVLQSLTSEEIRKQNEFSQLLDLKGCILLSNGKTILGEKLFNKLHSIGFFDVNSVSNEQETSYFITRPSSFCKYGNPFTEDALDLAKAFVTSLAYGMHQSTSGRGKIKMLDALLKKLIAGYWVGPASAIGQDYQVLEYKRVVEIAQSGKEGQFKMRLLKKDIGEIALKVLEQGNASEEILLNGSKVTTYTNPENNREILRKKQNSESKRDMVNTLRSLRTNI